MTDQTTVDTGRRRRVILGGSVAVAVVALVTVLAMTGDPGPAEVARPAPSATSTASPTPAPTASPVESTPEPQDSPVPGADITQPDPDAPATEAPVALSIVERADGRSEATVPLEQPAAVRTGLTARVSQIEPVEAVANLPGEIGGPALRATVELTNDTAAPVDLTSAVLNAYIGPDARPAVPVLEPGSQPFPVSVAPGERATARGIFTIPVDERSDVRFELDVALGDVIVLFAGDATDA